MKILKNLKAAAEAILKRFPSKYLLFMVGNRNTRIKRDRKKKKKKSVKYVLS